MAKLISSFSVYSVASFFKRIRICHKSTEEEWSVSVQKYSETNVEMIDLKVTWTELSRRTENEICRE